MKSILEDGFGLYNGYFAEEFFWDPTGKNKPQYPSKKPVVWLFLERHFLIVKKWKIKNVKHVVLV